MSFFVKDLTWKKTRLWQDNSKIYIFQEGVDNREKNILGSIFSTVFFWKLVEPTFEKCLENLKSSDREIAATIA